ncbi:pseudaminic acid cytidylyltransferase [Gammaproteobacteria bacterium]|nr:pseudaminic acid cytidylyltransferase [Gammaproteobacteria bacterium]
MNIAIIPARGGSKRIPRKNIKNFAGKPMISYAIKTAIESKIFSKIIVSTDDDEIAEVALEQGAEVPFLRPKDLADDYTPTVPVIANAIRTLKELGENISDVCCIYPCVPFLLVEDLVEAYRLIKNNSADFCFPIVEFPSSIHRALHLSSNNIVQPMDSKNQLERTQDLKVAYYDAGQFYWGNVSSWLNSESLHTNSIGYIIPSWRAVDIDTDEDWKRAGIINEVIKNRIDLDN